MPGGQLEDTDFLGTPTAINNQWYHTLENCVRREVREETGLQINNIGYLCNIAIPSCIIVSYTADWSGGVVKLQESECTDFAWVDGDGLFQYDLIDGLEMEIKMALGSTEKPVDAFNA